MSSTRVFRLGTRGSQLARWQAEWVAARLRQNGYQVELVEITTTGDVDRSNSIEQIGTLGVFTKEIQRALLDRRVDLGVHSLKDLPTERVEGLTLAAVPVRESVADSVIVRSAVRSTNAPMTKLDDLPHAARVGTGSLRRRAQLLNSRPDLLISDVRGNVDTRLRKLDDGQFDAIVLAEAGLRRLGLADRIAFAIPPTQMLPAVGQGALGIECRGTDTETLAALAALNDPHTQAAVTAERALLAALRGGCMAPVGAWGRIVESELHLSAVVLSADGAQRLHVQRVAEPANAARLGQEVADELIANGASQLIADSRRS